MQDRGNDKAKARHGVQPTHKKVKGFQSLQLVWEGRIGDAIFRGGKKHGNSGETVINMAMKLVKYIRENYSHDVTINRAAGLGLLRAMVVQGSDGLDEITLTGPTIVVFCLS